MADSPIVMKVLPVIRAENLRKDKETYFATLCRDITDIIDKMAHPLTTRPLQLIKKIKLPMCGLSRGRNLIVRTLQKEIGEYKYCHYNLSDCTPLPIPAVLDTGFFIDLQGSDEDFPVYFDGQILHIKQDKYRIKKGRQIFCYNLAESDQAPPGIDLHIFFQQITRGAQGWIYFYEPCNYHHVYRLNIQEPTKVECLDVPSIDHAIFEIRGALKANILILNGGRKFYRWCLDTQIVTTLYFEDKTPAIDTHIDPLTGTMYYLNEENDLLREDGKVILAHDDENELFRVLITLDGQMITQTTSNHVITSWLYG